MSWNYREVIIWITLQNDIWFILILMTVVYGIGELIRRRYKFKVTQMHVYEHCKKLE